MNFTEADKLKAIAIVNVFETGRAFGDFSAVAVLDDGAGISYGISQFTHRSGALADVLNTYLANGGVIGSVVFESRMKTAATFTSRAVNALAADSQFINALRVAALTSEMRAAQIDVAMRRYLRPALDECSRRSFSEPLSLAVIYDSMVHGSYSRIAGAVRVLTDAAAGSGRYPADTEFERAWVAGYVRRRDAWLASIPRLNATRYRTRFFLNQISQGNWRLELPLRVQSSYISKESIDTLTAEIRNNSTASTDSAVGPSLIEHQKTSNRPSDNLPAAPPPGAQPPNTQTETRAAADATADGNTTCLDQLERRVNATAARYDQVDRIATTVTSRNDAAKSLWTTVVGSLSQTFWAVFGVLTGIPRDVWLVVAVVAGALMLLYLYRQVALGKIREAARYWR